MKTIYKTPFTSCDGYKLSHWVQSPAEVKYFYANMTPRKGLRPGIDRFVFFGLQVFLQDFIDKFQEDFFNIPVQEAIDDYVAFYKDYFKADPDEKLINHVRALRELGYLPLEIKALPEGSVVMHGIPVLTIRNTNPEFYWLTNFIETWLSCSIWQACTSATTAWYYKQTFDKFADETSDIPNFFCNFQGHDFSMRGMPDIDAATLSGMGHAVSFMGSDTCPALGSIRYYYTGDPLSGLIITSVPATEHSVMCAGGKETERETFLRLLITYPTGILSVVSDTWDFWMVVTVILPSIKDEIMARDGKLVIRPDSGDPVKIICGDPEAEEGSPEFKGLIQCLYEIFGGTTNSKGYIQLDDHIGAIYGDSITLDRQYQILTGLKAKGFSSTNIVLGIGSFTYQYVTRDTHGIAIKSTGIGTGEEWNTENFVPIFKDPKTDNYGKKSAKGILRVKKSPEGYYLEQNSIIGDDPEDCLKVKFLDGVLADMVSFSRVRQELASYEFSTTD